MNDLPSLDIANQFSEFFVIMELIIINAWWAILLALLFLVYFIFLTYQQNKYSDSIESVLLAISVQFLDFISNLQANTSTVTASAELSFLSGEIVISPEFMMVISIVMLILTSILASNLLGVIQEGKVKYGLKYAPIIIILCLTVFFILRRFISNFFAGIM